MEKVICRVGFMIHNFPGVKTFAIRGDLKIVIVINSPQNRRRCGVHLTSKNYVRSWGGEKGAGEGLKGRAIMPEE